MPSVHGNLCCAGELDPVISSKVVPTDAAKVELNPLSASMAVCPFFRRSPCQFPVSRVRSGVGGTELDIVSAPRSRKPVLIIILEIVQRGDLIIILESHASAEIYSDNLRRYSMNVERLFAPPVFGYHTICVALH